jgi:hypothetical protein
MSSQAERLKHSEMRQSQVALWDNSVKPRAINTASIVQFRPTRSILEVFLTGIEPETDLNTLLKSPLGVYVINSECIRDEIRVTLDIAPDDFHFTLRTLMSSLPKATIGTLSRRTQSKIR